MVAAFGLAVIALASAIMDYVPWPLGGGVFVLAAGAGAWLQRRAKQATVKPEVQKVESGLRIVEKELPASRSKPPHGLRLTISTEVAVSLGLRVVCDLPVSEVEALAQIGRGAAARQGVPPAVRESRQAWLFVVHNSPGQRELFLRVDLYAAQPFKVERVDQIRPGVKVALPEWKELDLGLQSEEETPAEAPPATPGTAASAPASAAPAGPARNAPPPAPAAPRSDIAS
jgi:hypothetical protein